MSVRVLGVVLLLVFGAAFTADVYQHGLWFAVISLVGGLGVMCATFLVAYFLGGR